MSDWMFEVAATMPDAMWDQNLQSVTSNLLADPVSGTAESTLGTDEDWTAEILSQDGYTLPGIVVTGPPRHNPGAPSGFFDWDGYDSEQPPIPPDYTWEELTDCVTIVGGFETPDGATYVVPEGMDAEYINNAIKYLQSLLPGEKEFAFKEMYTNRNHPLF